MFITQWKKDVESTIELQTRIAALHLQALKKLEEKVAVLQHEVDHLHEYVHELYDTLGEE